MLNKENSEDFEQKQLIQWCRTDPRFQYLFHIANESVGGFEWIVRNRQMGCKKGVPDLFYPVPLKGYHGLFIELKRKDGGRLSDYQKRWLHLLENQGYAAVVCHGAREAADAIISYLEDDKTEKRKVRE